MEQDWHARGDMAQSERLRDWLESQTSVLGFWIDRMLESGDADMLNQLEHHRNELQGLLVRLG